ncbi:acyltransferase family protein [Clostridium neuense]|uniref:Acyltransferase family protein n=1 Tax=Clostridium neuense TaxID=1728934 RepID=A0ABW8TEZ3_9CLOT
MPLDFKLSFTQNAYIYLLAFLIVPLLVFYKSIIFSTKTYNTEFLSKPLTDCIKGLCITVIILHHIALRIQPPKLMLPYTFFGHLAVSIFFFLSGYGLTMSKLQKNNYLNNFFSKRLTKVYLPFILVNAITLIFALSLFNSKFSLIQILLYLSGLNLIDSTQWFVISILLFYIVFYLCFKFLNAEAAPKVILIYSFVYFFTLILFRFGEWWYNTAFCFPIGVYIALNYDKFISFIKRNYAFFSTLALICFAVTFYLGHFVPSVFSIILNTISSVCFVFVMLCFLFKVKITSKPLFFIGGIAYEIYLIHMKIFILYFNCIKIKGSYTVYIYLALVILVSFLFNKLFKLMRKPILTSNNKIQNM